MHSRQNQCHQGTQRNKGENPTISPLVHQSYCKIGLTKSSTMVSRQFSSNILQKLGDLGGSRVTDCCYQSCIMGKVGQCRTMAIKGCFKNLQLLLVQKGWSQTSNKLSYYCQPTFPPTHMDTTCPANPTPLAPSPGSRDSHCRTTDRKAGLFWPTVCMLFRMNVCFVAVQMGFNAITK